ncbi:MAG: glutaminyl-peptide cyclotransferase [Bacteroidota bacterium]
MRITLVLLALVGLVSCTKTSERQAAVKTSPVIRKASKLVAPKNNSTFRFGEAINFEIETRNEVSIDSVTIEYPTERVTYEGDRFEWTPSSPRAGFPRIRLVVHMGESKESLYPKVRFLPSEAPKSYTYRLINTYPHDTDAWIQGLFIHEDTLFEGTGRKGQSWVRKSDLQTGKVYEELRIADEYFGEGIAMHEDKIFQLTWQEHEAFVYDRNLKLLNTFQFPTEGWGLTNFGDQLIMSDGSEKLYVMDPGSFAEVDRLEVYDNNEKIDQLNELEMIDGVLFANVWFEEYIVMIDPASGAVVGKLDLTGLLNTEGATNPEIVLNGIAYDTQKQQLIVTGKLHPLLFEIEMVEKFPLN